jgi:hypothetical protein
MAKYYIYYNQETEQNFCTVYEWISAAEIGERRYCSHIGNQRYTHTDLQLDIAARILTDKRTARRYALVEPKKPRNNLQYETVEMEIVEWVEAF